MPSVHTASGFVAGAPAAAIAGLPGPERLGTIAETRRAWTENAYIAAILTASIFAAAAAPLATTAAAGDAAAGDAAAAYHE